MIKWIKNWWAKLRPIKYVYLTVNDKTGQIEAELESDVKLHGMYKLPHGSVSSCSQCGSTRQNNYATTVWSGPDRGPLFMNQKPSFPIGQEERYSAIYLDTTHLDDINEKLD